MAIPLRRLSPDEVAQFFTTGVPQFAQYLDALRPFKIGDAGEVPLSGATRRALKRRLTIAGRHLGLRLEYGAAVDNALRFRVAAPRVARVPR